MYTASTLHNTTPHPFLSQFFPTSPEVAHRDIVHPTRLQASNHPTIHRRNRDRDDAHYPSQLDREQALSAAIQAGEGSQNPIAAYDPLPISQSIPSLSPQSETVSVSPAATFLSSFSPVISPRLPDAEGEVVAGYTLADIVGYGGFSTIRRALSTSGGVVAIKIVRQSDLGKQSAPTLALRRLHREAAVWASLSHEHILPLFSAVHTSYADYFVTLYCPAGSLFDILKRDGRPALPQDDAGMMFRQVVRGLRYMHEVAGYVHRDVKLENILVDEMGVCKIGDFGMTRKIGEIDEEDEESEGDHVPAEGVHRAVSLAAPSSKRMARPSLQPQPHLRQHVPRHRNSTSTQATGPLPVFQPGSLPYAAPELLLPHSAGPLLPQPAQDIWALGVMLFALLTGRLPFVDSFEPRLQLKILNGVYEIPTGVGRGAERVLKGCMERAVPNRWNIAMVDEVAWGVGWGDEATPAGSDDEYEVQCSPSPASRSRSRHPDVVVTESPDWKTKEPRQRPSLEAASRRSSSRVQRVMSRAPVLGSRSSSIKRGGRSKSRHSRAPSPSFSALNNAILNPGPLSSSSSTSSQDHESAMLSSPGSSLERGRRPNKLHFRAGSRSPSPSVVPSTPVDVSTRFTTPLHVSGDDSHDLDRESSRGRSQYSRPRPEQLFSTGFSSELDVLDETPGWTTPGTKTGKRTPTAIEQPLSPLERGRPIDDLTERWVKDASVLGRGPPPRQQRRRSSSTPRAPVSPWLVEVGKKQQALDTLIETHVTVIAESKVVAPNTRVRTVAQRSRSLSFERRKEDLSLLHCG